MQKTVVMEISRYEIFNRKLEHWELRRAGAQGVMNISDVKGECSKSPLPAGSLKWTSVRVLQKSSLTLFTLLEESMHKVTNLIEPTQVNYISFQHKS